MPCHLTIYDTEKKQKTRHTCDEDVTNRLVEEDHAASATAEYTDTSGNTFTIDWTTCRLIGFQRRSDRGDVIASGGADGTQSEAPPAG